MKIITIPVGVLGVNCYIYVCEATKEAAVIDPGDSVAEILLKLTADELKVKYIINTHGHCDHIGANTALKAAVGAKIMIHAADAPMLTDAKLNLSAFMGADILSIPADRLLKDGDTIAIGNGYLQVLHTPGHTPGGVSLYGGEVVFSGDSLFAQSIGRCDFPGGSQLDLIDSIKTKLLVLDDAVRVLPGHGAATSIGRERRMNSYL